MSSFIEEISEMWAALVTRRKELVEEYRDTSVKATKLSIELSQVEKLIETLSPISELEAAYNYLQSLQGSANVE